MVNARQDGFFDLDLTSQIAESVRAADLVILEDSGHLAAVEQPRALTALIRIWLQN